MRKNRWFRKSKRKTIIYCQDVILKALFLLFRLFPIEKNKIVISCFKNLGFCDSPKYIALELLQRATNCKLVWLCDDAQESELPKAIRQVPYYSFRSIYEQVTARIWISNRRRSRYVYKRKGQFYLQTWHGGIRLKNIERSAKNVLSKRYCDGAKRDSAMIDMFLSNSDFCTKIIYEDMWYTGLILQNGLPRNDILIHGKYGEIALKTRRKFHVPEDANILLYAPTFRSDMSLRHYTLHYENILDALEHATSQRWILFIHYHTNNSERRLWNSNSQQVINVSKYLDVQELLIASQMLLSDYSSIIFDFALMNKPIIQYMPDYWEYKQDRGFNQSVEALPFIQAYSQQELLTKLSQLRFDDEYPYRQWMEKTYGLVETGKATQYAADVIENILKGN